MPLSTEWPRSSSFEDGVPGEVVTPENSIVGGLHWDADNVGYPWDARFTDIDAHSGSVAIIGKPGSYENLHFPFGDDQITAVDESFFFWCKFVGGDFGAFSDSCSPHQLYTGPLDGVRNLDFHYYPGRISVQRIDDTTNEWLVEFEDGEVNPDGNTQFTFTTPAEIWTKIGVEVTATGNFSYTLTEEGGTVHGPFSSAIDGWLLGLTPAQYFAFHFITVNDDIGGGYGRLILDDVNTDGVPDPETPGPPFRAHYHHTLRTEDGAVYRGATVDLLLPGTDTSPPDQRIYVSATGSAERSVRWFVPDGVIDFYVDDPASFDILVTPLDPGQHQFRLNDQWAGDVENRVGDAPNSRGVPAGHVPLADGQGSWEWTEPAPVVDSVNSRTGVVSVDAEELGAVTILGAQRAVALTRAEYDALTPKDGQTLYIIKTPAASGAFLLDATGSLVSNGEPSAFSVGSSTPLSDDSDASYVQGSALATVLDYAVGFEQMTPGSFVPGSTINLHLRLSLTGGDGPAGTWDRDTYLFLQPTSTAPGGAQLGQFTTGALWDAYVVPPPRDGTIQDIVLPFRFDDATFSEADLVAALEAGAFLVVNTLSNETTGWTVEPVGRIYKAWLEVTP